MALVPCPPPSIPFPPDPPKAAEVGLGPGGLARHLINLALFAAGQDPLLPPPHPPALEASAQWAQLTGANDTLGEIAAQLADTNEKVREALEMGHHRVSGVRQYRGG